MTDWYWLPSWIYLIFKGSIEDTFYMAFNFSLSLSREREISVVWKDISQKNRFLKENIGFTFPTKHTRSCLRKICDSERTTKHNLFSNLYCLSDNWTHFLCESTWLDLKRKHFLPDLHDSENPVEHHLKAITIMQPQHINMIGEKGSGSASAYAVLMFDIISDIANIHQCAVWGGCSSGGDRK